MENIRKKITMTVVENSMIDIDNEGQETYTLNEEQFGLLIDNLVVLNNEICQILK